MSKISTAFAFAAILAGAAIPANAETMKFSRDGKNYVAKVTQLENGATRISGHEVTTGARFRLYVRRDMVTGQYGSSNVAFATPVAETLLSSR